MIFRFRFYDHWFGGRKDENQWWIELAILSGIREDQSLRKLSSLGRLSEPRCLVPLTPDRQALASNFPIYRGKHAEGKPEPLPQIRTRS